MSDGPVTLREITPDNEAAVRALKVAPGQEQFVTSVPVSLDEAKRSPDANPWFRAIYSGERPVGFVMLSYNVPPGNPKAPFRTSCGGFLSTPGISVAATYALQWDS